MSIHNSTSMTRKRPREDTHDGDFDQRPFIIRDASNNPFSAPRTFHPLCLLSRTRLPLAYLDPATSGSKLFHAHVAALEASYELGNEAKVLVAREGSAGRLYAVERVQRKCYAICRLGEWLTETEVIASSTIVIPVRDTSVKKRAVEDPARGRPWWDSAAVDVKTPVEGERQSTCALSRLVMERMMNAPQQGPKPMASGAEKKAEAGQSLGTEYDTTPITEVPTSAEDIMKELAKYYLEALYLSRISLAYFTKGPLSRARAAFTVEGPGRNVSDLVDFLRGCILLSTAMDKKYRESVGAAVKELAPPSLESPEKTPCKSSKKKPRKWKPKRDKEGFFVDEHGYVERWWHAKEENLSGSASVETREATIRGRVAQLRNRETLLQIILVLEILALEAAFPNQLDDSKVDPESQAVQQAELGSPSLPKKTKTKKRQDLKSLLETLLDKLCIWQSLELHSPTKRVLGEDKDKTDETNDELRNFCIEIILPFYSSRIPQHAFSVNKKLGGPTAPTGRNTQSRKPGEPAVRQPPERKARDPLTRVSTDTLQQPSKGVSHRLPGLHRASTESDLTTLTIKREGSEVPLETIPPFAQHSRRSSVVPHQLKAFSKREVDLSAASATNEAKAKKKKDVEAKLKEAVEMLKKPNRQLAVKEIEERTDQSFSKAIAKSKGIQRASASRDRIRAEADGTRNAVHVAATPGHVRTGRQLLGRTPSKPSEFAKALDSASPANLKGVRNVPSTSRQAAYSLDPPMSTPAVPQTRHRPRVLGESMQVQETPSRGFAKFMPLGLASKPGSLETPVGKRFEAKVQQTPCKSSVSQPLVAASPNLVRAWRKNREPDEHRSPQPDKSIYDALGWDDDRYEQLS